MYQVTENSNQGRTNGTLCFGLKTPEGYNSELLLIPGTSENASGLSRDLINI